MSKRMNRLLPITVFSVMNKTVGTKSEIPRKYLVDELRRIANILGKVPTGKEFDANSQLGCARTCVKKFVSWNNFLISAGFEPGSSRLSFSLEELQHEFKRIAKMIGHTPSSEEFTINKKMGSASAIVKHFGEGSWPKACRALGFVPPKKFENPAIGGWNKGINRADVNMEKVRYLYEIEGRSMSSIASEFNVSIGTIRRRMDSSGIEVRKTTYVQPIQTLPESILYAELEKQRVPHMRQQPIDGYYVVDALVPGAKIVIEADGDYWHRTSDPKIQKRDQKKTKYLEARGYIVFRFTETELKADAAKCVDQISAIWRQYKK